MTNVLFIVNGEYHSDASGDILSWKMVDALGHTPSSIELTLEVGQLDGFSMLHDGLTTTFATMVVYDTVNGRGSLGRQIWITELRLRFDAGYGKPLITMRGRTVSADNAGGLQAFRDRYLNQLGPALSAEYGIALEEAYGDPIALRVWLIEKVRDADNFQSIQAFFDDVGFRVYWPATRAANAAAVFLLVPFYDPEAPLVADDVDIFTGSLTLTAADLTRPASSWEDTPVRATVLTPDTNDDPKATYTLQVSGDGSNAEILLPEVYDTHAAAAARLVAEQWKLRAGVQYSVQCPCYPAIRAGTRWQPWSQSLIAETFYATTQTHPCLLYTSPSPRDRQKSRMPSSA